MSSLLSLKHSFIRQDDASTLKEQRNLKKNETDGKSGDEGHRRKIQRIQDRMEGQPQTQN